MHSSSIEIAKADYKQVYHILKESELLPMRLHSSNQTHAELFRQLRVWLGERAESDLIHRDL